MLRGFLFYLTSCLLSLCVLEAQMMPSDPVLDFRLPRFSSNGYPQWILRGGKGIYDGDEKVRVETMSLRVYSGDERRTLEMTIDSPKATFLVRENRAVSESPIEIVGASFKVSGVGWTWDGVKKEIQVKSEVVVEFSQEVAGMLSGRTSNGGDPGEAERLTKISSNRLLLKTTPEAYNFQFIESVEVVSDDTHLKSELLVAIADAPAGDDSGEASVAELELDSIDRIIATEQVVISQAGNVLKAGEAEFSLRTQSAEFRGNPSIKSTGAYLSGGLIRSEKGKLVVEGNEEFGRAQMTIYRSGGLGVVKGVKIEQETVVFADTIKMLELEAENQFSFKGSVEATSGEMMVRTDELTLYLDSTIDKKVDGKQSDKAESSTYDNFRIGELVRVVGDGSVYIKQADQVATCEHAVFYPKYEHAILSGNPKVEHEKAIISGITMELKKGTAVVNGSSDRLVEVILPKLPDLGAEDLRLVETIQSSEYEASKSEQPEIAETNTTIVKAETLQMTENPDHYLLNFTDSVLVEGNNMRARCSRMDVILVEREDSSGDRERVQVKSINAYEDVLFEQRGRKATADTARIDPVEGEVVLEGNAVLSDVQGTVAGHRITLHKGKGRAIVEGDGTEGSRARITLPEMEFPEIGLGEQNLEE